LLLDEPLSNLDAKLREETRAALRALHQSTGVTTIYVTHDQNEAMAMSSRIAVLYQGRIHQLGTPEEIYERPATRFVASFIGRNNVLDATVSSVSGNTVTLRFQNGHELSIDRGQRAAGVDVSANARVGVCLRAESFQLRDGGGLFCGTVKDVEYSGSIRSCTVQTDAGDLEVEVPAATARPAPGQRIALTVNPGTVHLIDGRRGL
jgi:iron(III) transport system ATP-binding protein